MSKATRRRVRQRKPKPAPQVEPLAAAKTTLRNAVHDLTSQRPEYHNGTIQMLPSRYTQLRDSLYGNRGQSGHHTLPSSTLPGWVDALKLLGWIDRRAAVFEHYWPPRCANCPHWRYLTHQRPEHPTIRRYRQILVAPWGPQDTTTVETISTIVGGYVKAIDDLFAPAPVYLRGERCPRCGQSHTRMMGDEGIPVTRPALMVTGDGIAVCNACHDVFPSLEFLGDLLRYAKAEQSELAHASGGEDTSCPTPSWAGHDANQPKRDEPIGGYRNMAKDQHLYARFALNFARNPKIRPLSDAAFRCLVEAILWSREEETDGFLARRLALASWSLEVLRELCANDDEKPSLIERDEGWYIHDYAEQQDTKAEIDARRARAKDAGRLGGLARAKQPAKRTAKQPAKRTAKQNPSIDRDIDIGNSSGSFTRSSNVSSAPARTSDDTFALATTDRADTRSGPVTIGGSRLVELAVPYGSVPDAARTVLRIKASQLLAGGATEDDVGACLRIWLTKPDLGPNALAACMTEVYKQRNGHQIGGADAKCAGWQSMKDTRE